MSPDHIGTGLRACRFAVVAAATLLVVRVALWVMPYRRLQALLPHSPVVEAPGWARQRTLRAVSRAARVIPGASCLPQAIAGQVLLSWQGFAATVRIGVAWKGEALQAHAWLLSGRHLVLGGSPAGLAGFTPLIDLRAGPG